MNAAEIKLDIFRTVDRLNEDQLKKLYDQFLLLMDSDEYKLSPDQVIAIDEALKNKNVLSTNDVLNEGREKYKNLRF